MTKQMFMFAGVAVLSLLGIAGCGNSTLPPSTTNPTNAQSSQPAQFVQNTPVTQPAASTPQLKTQRVTLTVLPGANLGPDNKMHDTFSPADFQVVQGVPVELTVENYDGGAHSITAPDLGLNVQVKGSTKTGVPAVTTYTFTPDKAGDFTWTCIVPCDGESGGWAMAHDGYMKGTIKVVPQTDRQDIYLTIKDGLQFAAADGKLHDSYSPADFTVQAGIPVYVTVYNYDEGEHSMVAPGLRISQVFSGAPQKGAPSITTFTFTPDKAGTFPWQCTIKCDGGMTSYAMTHDGYMKGTITVVN